MNKLEFQALSTDQQLAEIQSILTTMTSTDKRFFERMTRDQQLADIWNSLQFLAGYPIRVSTTGSDTTGDGTEDKPFATVQKAIEKGGGNGIIVLSAGTYAGMTVDCTDVKNLSIIGEAGAIVNINLGESNSIFTRHDSITYPNVWNCSLVNDIPEDTGDTKYKVFEIGTPFGAITDETSHPLQRSRAYRLDDTPLTRRASIALVNSNAGSFYYDPATNKLYISKIGGGDPNGTTYTAMVAITGNSFIHSCNSDSVISIDNVGVFFGLNGVDFTGCRTYRASNCRFIGNERGLIAGGITLGGYECNNEYAASADDGAVVEVTTGNKRPYIYLQDGWVHDNGDEGWNPHRFCTVKISGGLFEYNSFGGGITIPVGASAVIENILTRYNDFGISVQVDDSPAQGNIINVTGWKSDHDLYGYFSSVTSGSASFVNCVIDSPVNSAFYNGNAGHKIRAINQYIRNCTTGICGGTAPQSATIYLADPVYESFSPTAVGPRSIDGSVTAITYKWCHSVIGIAMTAASSTMFAWWPIPNNRWSGRRVKIRALFGDNQNDATAYDAAHRNLSWKGVIAALVSDNMVSVSQVSASPSTGYVINDSIVTFATPYDEVATNIDFWKMWSETPAFTMPQLNEYEQLNLCVYRMGADATDDYPREVVLLAVELVEVPEQG